MEVFRIGYSFLLSLFLLLLVHAPSAQLVPAETRILYQVQQFLEYPDVLKGWNNWTNFCSLPQSPSLVILCSGNHITELTIVGNKSSPSKVPKPSAANFSIPHRTLSQGFSIDSFFTVITKLSNLKRLSLVSLGIWGPLPAKVDRLDSLEVLNISSNFIQGGIPPEIATFKNLKSLVLADNLLNGSIPDPKGLSQLEELDISNNPLGPKFPSLGNNLVRINLRSMALRSQIPPDFIKFNRLQILDISSNKFQGPIPSFLFSLPSIESINLAKNQLSGELPASVSCHENLTFVDVSNNLLIGMLPSCLGSNSKKRKVIDSFNCLSKNTSAKYQRPYSFCHKEALAVQPPTRKQKERTTVKLGLVLGVIVAVVAIIAVLGVLVLVVYRRLERNRAKEYKCESFVFDKNAAHTSPVVHGRHVPRTMRIVSLNLPPYHVFTLEEIEDATDNFDAANLVAEVSQAQIYRGWVRDGSAVLVRCLKLKRKYSPQSLQQHMEVISRLRHRHLVSVLGHCIVTYQDHPNTPSKVIIVLENVANGSLRDHLTDWRKREILKWPQRISIMMSIAKGIQYLHTSGVIGNDLKIENILLDESLSAKISSYNVSLPSKVGSESPLNGQDSPLSSSENTDKDDIYQLGVILLEVITGRPIISPSDIDDLKLQLEICLAESPSKLKDLTDLSIRGTFAYESLKTVAQITISCLNKESSSRPSIEDILWHMQYSVQVQEGWNTSSGNLATKL
ncbi:probable LRR receptor-like serine/threonine-protein kinase At1g14390 [Coffea arabica]|uniref:Probable LRR receptor-like serine/threonine-protein kinase At1g14390 n=1 Tax=Coffea arabica TaxID=13443 RepID=A0ABM4VFA1_COFAR